VAVCDIAGSVGAVGRVCVMYSLVHGCLVVGRKMWVGHGLNVSPGPFTSLTVGETSETSGETREICLAMLRRDHGGGRNGRGTVR
jgi:hypothetical protein